MVGSILIPLMFVAAAPQLQRPLELRTSGWCSPIIVNVTGNVTVNCIGVDPRALKRLNNELDKKNLALADKIREADDWTKRYKELELRLASATNDSVLSKQAEDYLHEGELEKAGASLDQILGSEEKQVDITAANHFNRALIFELQFRPQDAQKHFQKAYQYRPEDPKYGLAYGAALQEAGELGKAEDTYQASITTYPKQDWKKLDFYQSKDLRLVYAKLRANLCGIQVTRKQLDAIDDVHLCFGPFYDRPSLKEFWEAHYLKQPTQYKNLSDEQRAMLELDYLQEAAGQYLIYFNNARVLVRSFIDSPPKPPPRWALEFDPARTERDILQQRYTSIQAALNETVVVAHSLSDTSLPDARRL